MAPHQVVLEVIAVGSFFAGLAVALIIWVILSMLGESYDRAVNLKEYRRGFLAGFNFAVGKGGLPPEIIDWPSAINEVNKDHDPNCS